MCRTRESTVCGERYSSAATSRLVRPAATRSAKRNSALVRLGRPHDTDATAPPAPTGGPSQITIVVADDTLFVERLGNERRREPGGSVWQPPVLVISASRLPSSDMVSTPHLTGPSSEQPAPTTCALVRAIRRSSGSRAPRSAASQGVRSPCVERAVLISADEGSSIWRVGERPARFGGADRGRPGSAAGIRCCAP
jgi:hypothetical protein